MTPQARGQALNKHLAHLLVRRFIWFCSLYRGRVPLEPKRMAEADATVGELDNQLNYCQDLGLVPRLWQSADPPKFDETAGFAEDYVREHLTDADLKRLGML